MATPAKKTAAKKTAAVKPEAHKDGVNLLQDRAEPTLDPVLEKIRDEEIKKLEKVEVQLREEPTIDPKLLEVRDAEIKRQAEREKNPAVSLKT